MGLSDREALSLKGFEGGFNCVLTAADTEDPESPQSWQVSSV